MARPDPAQTEIFGWALTRRLGPECAPQSSHRHCIGIAMIEPTSRQRVRTPLPGVILACVTLLVVTAQASAQDLPDAAVAPYEHGLAASRQNEWALAVKYFKETEARAGTNPHVLFNLAVALDRAGGHELGAIARYRAFLVAVPRGAHADAARKRIEALEIRIEANALRLIEKAKQAGAALPDEYSRNSATEDIARNLARMGDVAAARQLAGTLKNENTARKEIAVAQARNGDFAGAKSTARSIDEDSARSSALGSIANEEAKAGRFTAAVATADSIASQGDRVSAYLNIARELDRAKRKADAISLVKKARALADRMKRDYGTSLRYKYIMEGFIAAGDLEAAEEAASLAVRAARESDDRDWIYDDLVPGLAKAGLIDRARSYVAKIKRADIKSNVEGYIRNALARRLKAAIKAGRLSEAIKLSRAREQPASALLELARLLRENGERRQALAMLARARRAQSVEYYFDDIASEQLALGDDAAAIATARLARGKVAMEAWVRVAKHQIASGKPASARKSLREASRAITSVPASKRSYAPYKVAEQFAVLGDTRAAANLADMIADPFWRAYGYRDIVRAELRKGAYSAAIAAALKIPKASSRGSALADIVGDQLRAGELNAAIATTGQIDDPRWRGNAIARVMSYQQERGRWREADALFAEIEDPDAKSGALLTKARNFDSMDMPAQARDALAAALKLTTAIKSVADRISRLRSLAEIADRWAIRDLRRAAIQGARKSIAQLKKKSSRDSERNSVGRLLPPYGALSLIEQTEDNKKRASAYRDMAVRLHREGDDASALALMQRAIAVAASLSDKHDQKDQLDYNVGKLAEIQAFKPALALAVQPDSPDRKGKLLASIALHAAKAKKPETALAWIDMLDPEYAERKAEIHLAAAEKKLDQGDTSVALLSIGRALKAVENIDDHDTRGRLYIAVANDQFRAGDKKGAADSIGKARKLVPTISSSYGRRSLIEKIAKFEIAEKRWDIAKKLARSEPNPSDRDAALARVASVLREAKELEAASTVIDDIREVEARDNAYRSLVSSLIAAEDIDSAARVIAKIRSPYQLSYARYDLAQAQIKNGDINSARKAPAGIRSQLPKVRPDRRDYIRQLLVRIEAALGQIAEARAEAARIERVATRQGAYIAIAGEVLKKGDAAAALDLLSEARATIGIAETHDGWARTQLAELYWRRKAYDDAEAELGRIDDPLFRSKITKEWAGRHIRGKDYEKALAIAITIPEQAYRAAALEAVIDAADKAGSRDVAFKAAVAIADPGRRGRALDRLARRAASGGQFGIARQMSSKIDEPAAKAFAYTAIARALIRAGDPENARGLLAEAIEVARGISDRYLAALAFADAGYAFVDAGDRDSARKVLTFDGRLAQGLSEPGEKTAAVRRVFGEATPQAETVDAAVEKEMKARSDFIRSYTFREDVYSDFATYLNEAMQAKDPGKVVARLAEAAGDIAIMARRLRKMDEAWQQKRRQAGTR